MLDPSNSFSPTTSFYSKYKFSNTVQLCTTLYDSVQLCTTLFNSVQLCTTMYNSVRLCTTLYDSVRLCTAVYNSVQLCMRLRCIFACDRVCYIIPRRIIPGVRTRLAHFFLWCHCNHGVDWLWPIPLHTHHPTQCFIVICVTRTIGVIWGCIDRIGVG